ncbi:siroheme uroporphyrinogen methyltransferase 1 [Iris pallida]|uniref:uroporphyrinogen-III C-methyltransferase n=1 Tax=Iris pallida TaxID=29817 RepID=A0AAX6EHB4_IRIPA|nr:siroheme uroporphyrinogen methyltransferase 1 [Iris pallida]
MASSSTAPSPPPSSSIIIRRHHHHRILHFPIPSPYPRFSITLSCASSSSSSSPFTEFNSKERHERDSWINNNNNEEDNNDIALRLPDLKNLLKLLQQKNGGPRSLGRVCLVGTGPGDPDLLTVKAARAIETADLVLYDRLVSDEVLSLVGGSARMLYVGKTAGYHSRTQDEIHRLLLAFAEAGANVVRLKGGDPLVFGRGGEEMDFLQQQGIQVKVIPGITSASGIAAELGIPLTHRGVANSVRFLTGHSRSGGTDPLYVAEHAADPDSTLVIYMGLSTLPALALKLVNHGLPPDTPAVAVERGTTRQQRTVFSEIKDLVNEVKSAELVSPTLIIVGKVVALSPLWPQSSKRTPILQSEAFSMQTNR